MDTDERAEYLRGGPSRAYRRRHQAEVNRRGAARAKRELERIAQR